MTCTAHVTPANKTPVCLTGPMSQARCIAVCLSSNLPAELQATLSLPGWQLSVQKCKLNMLPAIGLTDACYCRCLADLLLDRKPTFDIKPMSATRDAVRPSYVTAGAPLAGSSS